MSAVGSQGVASTAGFRAAAPGKVVLSGAYAVLEGAPAIVAAADRYVLADASRAAELLTPEVSAALGAGALAPWFDASALRASGRKLGLGSSAAIVVASLGALELASGAELGDAEVAMRVFEQALRAHRAAQGGGSGIDVAASTFGGVLVAQQAGSGLALRSVELPAGVCIRVLASETPASTPALIAAVGALRARDAALHGRLLGAQADAAERAAAAAITGDAAGFVAALAAQGRALSALGAAAGVPIVTPSVERLLEAAELAGAAALPAGAGGGDISLWVTAEAAAEPPELDQLTPLDLRLGARGLHRAALNSDLR
jgi:phosphomevalonate kinase